MANRKRTSRRKIPVERYRKIARDLSIYAPKLKPLVSKKTLSATDRRAITRIEDRVHKLSAGSQRLVSLTEKQISQLKDKSFLAKGLNAVVDRNLASDTKAVVKNGQLFIRENGRYLKLIKGDATNPEKFVEQASSLFKGKRGRFNVWVRFNNGRSNSAFTDEAALLDFIIQIYEKYQPDWQTEGHDIDEFIDGFEVYEQPKGIKIRRKGKAIKPKKRRSRLASRRKAHRRKSTSPRKRGKAPRKKVKTSFVKRALKARFTAEKSRKKPRAKPKAVGDTLKAKVKRGKAKKNRRH